MWTKITIDGKSLVIPFSSRSIANSFVRGFNEHKRADFQNREYVPENDNEQRGARFAEIIIRYCEHNSIKLRTDKLEVREDKENCGSIFDGFE
jgi:hypothetical protein